MLVHVQTRFPKVRYPWHGMRPKAAAPQPKVYLEGTRRVFRVAPK